MDFADDHVEERQGGYRPRVRRTRFLAPFRLEPKMVHSGLVIGTYMEITAYD
jgi:hypothetical protein